MPLFIPGGPKKKSPKYRNEKAKADGREFDSKMERDYYLQLKMLKMGGVIKDFDCQIKFELIPKYTNANGVKIRAMNYIADFVVEYKDGHTEIVDVKGFRTKEYELKKKLFEYKYLEKGYFIVEIEDM